VFHFVLLYVFVAREVGSIRTKELVIFFLKITAISVVMGAAVYFMYEAMTAAWNSEFMRVTNAIIVLINGILGAAMYFILVKLSGIREGNSFFRILFRK